MNSTKNLSRRQFIGVTGAALLSTAWLGAPRLFAEEKTEAIKASIEKYSGFKMGIQSYSLRHFNVSDTIKHTADLGLHWIEFYPGQFGITQDMDRINEVKDQLKPHDMRLSVHGVNGFGGNEQNNRNIFEFAKLAGIPLISCDPHPDSYPILHDLVQEYDIKVGIHNHGPGHRYDRITDSLEAVEPWDKRFGFCPDTGHYMRSGEDPVEMVHLLKDRLYGMHLKDHDGIHRDGPPETILGEGVLDLEAFCTALREVGFDEPISLEYELNPRDPIDDIRRGLDNFANAAKATA
ncbi:MAG: sugar phosphate isomerase/epimerase [Opitutales bacterium]